jgi:hypothetical protein
MADITLITEEARNMVDILLTEEGATEKNIALIEQARTLAHTDALWCEDYENMISGMMFVILNPLMAHN